MNPIEEFQERVSDSVQSIGANTDFLNLSSLWIEKCIPLGYMLNFSWLGRPIVQIPQDSYAIQELIWKCRPDLIIETGIAHGGSLIMSASILALLDYCDAVEAGTVLDPKASERKVVGVDIDIRAHNRAAIEAHPMSHKITMIQGSSVDKQVIAQVKALAEGHQRVMVFLDSNHTHQHVLDELELYAPLVSKDCYCVVWDTLIEDMPDDMYPDRPWSRGDNPKTAVWEYMRRLEGDGRKGADGKPLHFAYDKTIENKIAITVSRDGFLKRV
ncbi:MULTISPECIES: cephalosporin hydroxylase family protein [Alphaproteobacteria]|uniref:Cephalosporin hydroxylase n=2 Tax=Alphaproteobacteria TaxID=28211 RepID=A0A512HDH6_9HYPH|nr:MULTISPECIES: cephalosporin hydroxylase family protein [Alphaproteobacteria]GEO83495.1 cephalosporin hydroxylase [Ciceribacter naphthalenivorans]GLR24354.1 cephalosporin hydroxylase [Ciceribacter naphthalenivorans]GLT07210.1 cephalosporin hydroxylase [Sphingomonas psychrolutea]